MKKNAVLIFVFMLFAFFSTVVNAQINFNSSNISNLTIANPTSLQFGPDGRLYVCQQNATIKVFTIVRNAANNYSVTSTETILLVKQIPNHYDDGTPKPFNINTNSRQATGIYVTGTASNPMIYICSSDNDIGAGSNGDKNLCTNSGILSKLTWNGTKWTKMDLVRGLPRSEENHAPNGIQIDESKQMLYLAIGGITNAGSPSKLFAYTTEYALSAAVLSIDLQAIEAMPTQDAAGTHPYKYNLPTLDDPTRSNNADGTDINDPFGGNDGLNQAKIVVGGPVKVFVPGFRNPYDLVITKTPGREGRLYINDNGANTNWGGYPANEGPQGNCTNNYVSGEPGSVTASGTDGVVNNLDGIHKIDLATYVSGTFYGGHPCPVRANPAGAGLYTDDGTLESPHGVFRTSTSDPQYPLPADWPPVPVNMANHIEGDFQNPGQTNGALLTFDNSTNGICEYTASNFNNALKGDLLVINYEGAMYRIKVAADGSISNSKGSSKLNQDPVFASGFGTKGLDITAQGDGQIFPGTIWVVNYASNTLTVFEPQNIACVGTNSSSLDEDGDGFKNSDEIANGTDPCSAASKPNDNDQDKISDLNDTDDDNDGKPDTNDAFALDASNGNLKNIPITYTLFNNDPGTGFFGLGFTGLMTNKTSDYITLYDNDNLIAGGAVGALTIDQVPAGDALGNTNTQKYAFQFGVNTKKTSDPFLVRGAMLGKFFNGLTPVNFQSQGIFIGNGDQDNYLKVVLNANGGVGGIQVVFENQGTANSFQYSIDQMPSSVVEVYIAVDPFTGLAQVKVSIDGSAIKSFGSPIQLAGPLLTTIQDSTTALAVGIISTSRSASAFNATWDLLEIKEDPSGSKGDWTFMTSSDGSIPEHRHEDGFVQCGNKFYLLGGRGVKNVNEYDPLTKTWKVKAKTPVELNHFQGICYNNLIYVICAFNGLYPTEVPVPNIYIYDPAADVWIKGREIPEDRRRGSAGVVVYNDKIYIACGIINGHTSGFVSWLDEYNPATNEWKTLTDAPRARDHFQAVLNNGKMYLAGGRRSSGKTNQVFNLVVPEVDIYDFVTGTWSTNANNIPTTRAGCTAVPLYDEVVVIGGESMAHLIAHNETEALNINTGKWRSLDTLNTGRHGTQAIVSNNGIYITGGASSRGGSAATELPSVEEFHLTTMTDPSGDPLVRSGIQSPAVLDFGSVANGQAKSDAVKLLNIDGNQGIMIKDILIRYNTGNVFSFQSPYVLPYFIAPDKFISIPVSVNSNGAAVAARLVIKHSGNGDSTVIVLKVNNPVEVPNQWSPVFFVNAGGDAIVAGANTWLEDSKTNPSSYSNSAATFNQITTVSYNGVNNTDAPTLIFNNYRWDGGVKGNNISNEMGWKFPVAEGDYKIILYFTESSGSITQAGQRVFDIMIEDTIRDNNFDIVAVAGFKNAIMKTYQLHIKDGFININFLHEVQNPLINGIAIYKKNATQVVVPMAQATPSSIDFGSQNLNTVSTQAVTVKNTGTTSVTLSQVNFQGANGSEFTHDFTSSTTLAAGAQKIINVSFKPVSAGTKSAVLALTINELSTPLSVSLTGKGVIVASNNVSITKPSNGASFYAGDSVKIEASVIGGSGSSVTYLKVNCPDNAFRKLKIGYDPVNLYNPPNNVIAGGNNNVEIVAKAVATVNWTKIQFRPQGNSTTPVVLGNYLATAQSLSDGYMKFTIPITAFNSGIDFTKLTNIEFPYSAGAGVFEMNVQTIAFTGGATPFNWFGNGKTNNKQDGVGGSGQLLATLITSQTSGRTINSVTFYQNNNMLGTDNTSPYQYTWKNLTTGSYDLTAKASYSDGDEYSAPVSINVQTKPVVPPTGMKVVVVFDQVPQTYSISNATLKYNKDFAYSFTLDDGKIDAYTHGFTLLNGGHMAFNNKDYPGLYFTDGCGNNISFKAGLAWNSQNTDGSDPHISAPGSIHWGQLSELYGKGWNVLNHSLDHRGGTGVDYNFEVTENSRIIKLKTGIDTKHFVIPSGDAGYQQPAFNNGMVAVYDQSGSYPGVGGLKVDGTLNLSQFRLNRKFISDGGFDSITVRTMIDQVAAKSINGSHYWYNDFTHKVQETPYGGSLVFATFESYMKYIERTYGKSGKDNVWMAPLQDVYEYFAVKNNIHYSTVLNGNRLEITFDTTDVPSYVIKNALTLIVNSSTTFSSIETNGFARNSFKGSGTTKIINLEWNGINSAATGARMAALDLPGEDDDVIYRVNVGGQSFYSPAGEWESDSVYHTSKNSMIRSDSSSITYDNSMPVGTPRELFYSERSTKDDSLSWAFPVAEGGEVEVRLYFAETEFEDKDQRTFDVAIEDSVKQKELDVVKESGKKKGLMKSFRAKSDGSLNINLLKIKHNPSVRGIEIICLNEVCKTKRLTMSGAQWEKKKISATAYPNPFGEKLIVNFNNEEPENVVVRIYSSSGVLMKEMEVSLKKDSEVELNFSDLPTGAYYMKLFSGKKNETIKVIKK